MVGTVALVIIAVVVVIIIIKRKQQQDEIEMSTDASGYSLMSTN